ncbi:hypothetical protein H0O00_04415 [Candidatus Micrarchaeota archaeon]|nr:hypothetical protein [Candidatus Micrarchaeota archaeon]
MRVEIIAVLILLAIPLAAAALDQSYVHVVARDGTSTMEKSMELAVFSNQLTSDALEKMAVLCKSDRDLDCDVDVANKKVAIREKLSPGAYYSFSSDYGLPDITHTLVINSIPSDRFAADLDDLLVGAGVTESSGGSVDSIDLRDKTANNKSVYYLKLLKVNITYTVTMPLDIAEARAGDVAGEISGNSATFDLVKVMEESEPITVRCTELNLGYMVGIAGIAVIAVLAFLFLSGRKPEAEKPQKKRK